MNDRPPLNEHEAQARQALVALATAMLSTEVSFFEGAVQVLRLKQAIGGIADRDPDFDVFVAIESETDHLPLHAQQHLWDPEALAKLAPEFAKTEILGHLLCPYSVSQPHLSFRRWGSIGYQSQ